MRSRQAVFAALTILAFASASASPSAATPPLASRFTRGRSKLENARGKVPITVRLKGTRAADMGGIEVAPGIGARWVDEDAVDAFLRDHHELSPAISPPLHLLLDKSGVWTNAVMAHDMGRKGKGVVVGIIDTGLDLTHPDLRNADGTTRVAWYLDLGAAAPAGLHPDLESAYGCVNASDPTSPPCAVYAGADLDALVKKGTSYPTDEIGHGTHVSSIAAGNGGLDAMGNAMTPYVGMAPEATLVVVRVTRGASAEAITDADVLNAVKFVFDRATDLGMPAVVNLSLGGDFGPHDGTSALEAGLAGFVGPDQPGRAIVVAAGNSGALQTDDAGTTYGPHTETRVLPGGTTRAILTTPSPTGTVQGTAFVWITYRAGDDISVGVERNGDSQVDPEPQGTEVATPDGQPLKISVINGHTKSSSIPAGSSGAIVVLDGSWPASDKFAITLEGRGEAELWVQGSGDAEFGSRYGGVLFLQAMKQGTINVPATHPSLLSVGCTINRTTWPQPGGPPIGVSQLGSLVHPQPDSYCYFSAAGPNALGVPKPEIAAPGAFVGAAMSVSADPASNPTSMFVAPPGLCPTGTDCYVLPGRKHAIASGTSMSAPHVTGAVALLLEQDPTLTEPQLIALLQGGSRLFRGVVPLDFQEGPGALDIVGSFTALVENGAPPMSSPDPTKSWLELSSGYARPDPSFPVVGSVQVRDANGAPADGFDLTSLVVSVDEGVVTQPMTRVAPGEVRFAVAGRDGSGGRMLHVRVTWAGNTILQGDRELPIGADWWSTRGVAEARGGCATSRGGRGGGGWLAIGVGLIALHRRRSRHAGGPRCRGRSRAKFG